MTVAALYPKRLIEVDLPIKRISAHARREKSIRHGHISTLHIWWARRPLAACRAVLCAALWPDPLDEHCPQAFRDAAALALCRFADQVRANTDLAALTAASWTRWSRTTPALLRGDDPACWADMRLALLDFIADFANWDASTVPAFLDTARLLTHIAHLSLSDPTFQLLPSSPSESLQTKIRDLQSSIDGLPRPLVVDPFAGGGAIPLEALRVGADAFASDLNPLAVLLNKVVLEYIPKYGHRLADEVLKWGQWIKNQAERELAEFYPKDPDGATPIAYLWARTIRCEGPGCGVAVPLIRGLWLAKKGDGSVALRLVPNPTAKGVDFEIIERRGSNWISQADPELVVDNPKFEGTVARGSATCPVCGYTTPVVSVRQQLKARRGGAADAQLFAVVLTRSGQTGRFYRPPKQWDLDVVKRASETLELRKQVHQGQFSLVPDEEISLNEIRRISVPLYGIGKWGELFTERQALALVTLVKLVQEVGRVDTLEPDANFRVAVTTCLALAIDRVVDRSSSLCRYDPTPTMSGINNTFSRQALPIVWDFAEGVPISERSGGWMQSLEWLTNVIVHEASVLSEQGHVACVSATDHPLPSDCSQAIVTDPPYYDAVPYAYLSDFFYVWLRRSLGQLQPNLLSGLQVPKEAEIVVDRPHVLSQSSKGVEFYERELTRAFADSRRVLSPDGIGTIVFASKTTASWEAILQAVISAGWIITGSWPIDTEMETRVAAQGQARLASSIHLICRPRETTSGALDQAAIGEWRDVLDELPRRIHDWMPRLSVEGVVGADAIFACLGPALEIYSRYTRVEKASGEPVTLKEYLEHVWGAVAREALTTIFGNVDAAGFEPDARLTAIWFWTLKAATNGTDSNVHEEDLDHDEPEGGIKSAKGYSLEYDAARKLAQGLGADLAQLSRPGGIVAIKGSVAALSYVSDRAQYLLGIQLALFDAVETVGSTKQKRLPTVSMKGIDQRQMTLLDPRPEAPYDPAKPYLPGLAPPRDPQTLMSRLLENGTTLLDRLHQVMLLHSRSQTALLGPFLAESGAGKNPRFWMLAQALSALYPEHSDEKRWVDGVLARKKGLGF